ncbi:MAG: hypothetical protein IT569_06830 [Leptospiraceae bacterium]|nr:hypothetical protein [Leptospiraceae bacterium]
MSSIDSRPEIFPESKDSTVFLDILMAAYFPLNIQVKKSEVHTEKNSKTGGFSKKRETSNLTFVEEEKIH